MEEMVSLANTFFPSFYDGIGVRNLSTGGVKPAWVGFGAVIRLLHVRFSVGINPWL